MWKRLYNGPLFNGDCVCRVCWAAEGTAPTLCVFCGVFTLHASDLIKLSSGGMDS